MSRNITTKAEYEEFKKAFETFFIREEIEVFSGKQAEDGDSSEPYFSWRPCDCCGGTLGGNRNDVLAAHVSGKIIEYSVCDDCVYFNEYGKLDDLTMLKIGE